MSQRPECKEVEHQEEGVEEEEKEEEDDVVALSTKQVDMEAKNYRAVRKR